MVVYYNRGGQSAALVVSTNTKIYIFLRRIKFVFIKALTFDVIVVFLSMWLANMLATPDIYNNRRPRMWI